MRNFVVGVPKSATTSICKLIERGCFVDTGVVKEPNFYLNCEEDSTAKARLSYESNYHDESCLSELDCSVCTIGSERALRKIKKDWPDCKGLFIYCNPVTRLLSHYIMDVRCGAVCDTFPVYLSKTYGFTRSDHFDWRSPLSAFYYSEYSRHFALMNNIFTRDAILFVDSVGALAAPEHFLSQLVEFLGAVRRPGSVGSVGTPVHNRRFQFNNGALSSLYKRRWVRQVAKKILRGAAKDVRNLFVSQVNVDQQNKSLIAELDNSGLALISELEQDFTAYKAALLNKNAHHFPPLA